MHPQLIGLADGDNFFVSCEKSFSPQLAGKAVVVMSSNDGCIVARSAQAKALGLKMGEAVFKRRAFMQRQGVVMLSANLPLYAEMSQRVFQLLRSLVPQLQVYSIDEAFFGCNGITGDLHEWVSALHHRIKEVFGISFSIGIGHSKTMAKLAVQQAKQQPFGDKCCLLTDSAKIDEVLTRTEIGDIWGIGRRLRQRYHSIGIFTAQQLAQADPGLIRQRFGVMGSRIYYELRQICCSGIDLRDQPPKSCLMSRSFGQRVRTLRELHDAVSVFVNQVAAKLRRNQVLTNNVTVFINTNRFRSDYLSVADRQNFPLSNDTFTIAQAASNALRNIYRGNRDYCRAGVLCSELRPVQASSYDLFHTTTNNRRHEQLWQAIDMLNHRYGKHTLRCGPKRQRPKWLPRNEQRSLLELNDIKRLPLVS